MDFYQIEQAFVKRDLSGELLRDHKAHDKLLLSNSDKKKVQRYIEEYSFKSKFIPTLNYIVLGLLYDKEKPLDTLQRKGILRYSKYIETKNFPAPLSEAILSLCPDLCLNDRDRQYFQSILNLSPLHEIMKNLRRRIITEIKRFSKRPKIIGVSPSIVKSLLAALDFLFMTGYYPQQRETPNSLKFYTKEDIAEAISYIIYLKQRVFGLSKSDSYVVDEEYIVSDDIEAILLPACHFKALQEYEVMVDHYTYSCIKNEKGIRIIAPYPNFEKSIRIGYIRSELQEVYDLKELKHIASLEEVCERFLRTVKFDVFKYVELDDYPRYRIEMPELIFEKISEFFFKPKEVFREEARYLAIVFKEQFLDYDKLNDIKISKNLSLLDFFILKRFFEFFYYIFLKNVSDKLQTETKTILRSLIPTFTKEKIAKFYSGIVSEQAFNEFLEIVAWKPSSNSVFDIQYQPFIKKLNSTYMIPICVFVHSNSIRNVFASEYKLGNPNIMDNGEYDPISDLLVEAFEQRGFKTFTHKSHRYKQGGEIDFLALKDDFLFIAECKKFLHPTSIYEQRTIYDGLVKASDQLTLILEAVNDIKASQELSSLIGEDIKRCKIIKTSIVTNTRLFWGITLKKHPIRNIYELFNFVVRGNFRSEDGYYWFWENDYFTLNDLELYLDSGFPTFKGLYNVMLPKEIVRNFGKHNVVFETFVMNVKKARSITKDLRLRKVRRPGALRT